MCADPHGGLACCEDQGIDLVDALRGGVKSGPVRRGPLLMLPRPPFKLEVCSPQQRVSWWTDEAIPEIARAVKEGSLSASVIRHELAATMKCAPNEEAIVEAFEEHGWLNGLACGRLWVEDHVAKPIGLPGGRVQIVSSIGCLLALRASDSSTFMFWQRHGTFHAARFDRAGFSASYEAGSAAGLVKQMPGDGTDLQWKETAAHVLLAALRLPWKLDWYAATPAPRAADQVRHRGFALVHVLGDLDTPPAPGPLARAWAYHRLPGGLVHPGVSVTCPAGGPLCRGHLQPHSPLI